MTKGSTQCYLPSEPLEIYQIDVVFKRHRGPDFYELPLGGATQSYVISLSNDREKFSNEQNYTVFDSKCMDCNDDYCEQRV